MAFLLTQKVEKHGILCWKKKSWGCFSKTKKDGIPEFLKQISERFKELESPGFLLSYPFGNHGRNGQPAEIVLTQKNKNKTKKPQVFVVKKSRPASK